MANILAVDDDPDVLSTLQEILRNEGHSVTVAESGQEALQQLRQFRPDLIVLDVIMPEMSGVELCRRIRSDPYISRIPILFLTAKGRASDIAQGLDAGGDDYLVKPFDLVELPARIRALLRRAQGQSLDPDSEYLQADGLRLRIGLPEVHIDSTVIQLTAIEHQLLHCLMVHAGRPLPVEFLLQSVWGYPSGTGSPNVVQAAVKRLREKIEVNPDRPQYIRNVRGEGYMVPD